jgi:hypothetical protein
VVNTQLWSSTRYYLCIYCLLLRCLCFECVILVEYLKKFSEFPQLVFFQKLLILLSQSHDFV